MDTNSNIPPQKKVVSVEILHLDELGYGPQGKHTRREWRAECLENWLLGKSAFKSWQTNLVLDNGLPKKSFACKLILENGTTIPVLNDKYLDKQSSYALDYVGHVFEKSLHVSKYDFEHNALFNGARFNKFAYFAGCIFKLQALFSNSIFIRDSVFSRVEFNSYAAFRDIDFRKYANFRNTSFIEDADFSCSAFGDHVDFIRANFQSQCRFNKSQFQKLANFENAIFE